MSTPTKEIKEFIGVYDGWIPDMVCDQAIEYFKELDLEKKTYQRERNQSFLKKDTSCNLYFSENTTWPNRIPGLIPNLMNTVNDYLEEVPLKKFNEYQDLHFNAIKIQKTLPKEGYHVWHIENGGTMHQRCRVLVFSIYLNEVDNGGETEFLYQAQRVQPKKGRVVLWPAGFPYVHRGNPPLSGEKYIITSWLSGEFNL